MYTVAWLPEAALEFANVWLHLDPNQQAAVLAELKVFKQALVADPFGHGESREHGTRVMFEAPLGIRYRLEGDGYTVSILRVWRY